MLRQFQVKVFQAIAWFLAHLPASWYPVIARCLVIFAKPWVAKDRKRLRRNVAEVYRLPAHSSFASAFERQVFEHQAVSFLETLGAILNPKHKLEVKDFDALRQRVQQLLAKGRGLIIVTGHMGSWELVAHRIAEASSEPLYCLAKPSKLPAFTDFLDQLRSKMKARILWTDRRTILKDMMQVLRDKSSLGFVMDQKPDNRIGPVVDFLGLPTEFVSGPAKLALKFKTPVLGAFCMREGPMTYRMCFETVLEGDEENLDEVQVTQLMARSIEHTIRLYPEQWVWNYKRWRFAN